MDNLRRPTDDEMAIIGAVQREADRLRAKGWHPVAIGMTRDVIEDPERGRWSRVLGIEVLEIPGEGLVAFLLPVLVR